MHPPRSTTDTPPLVGVDAALDRILAVFSALDAVEVRIGDALGMVLARDIVSTENVPPFRNSAMDGYAVRSIDTSHVGDTILNVIESVAAGTMPVRVVGPGQAIRIMTGAPVPEGADAIVRFERTAESPRNSSGEDRVVIRGAVAENENVRKVGEDIRAGERLFVPGTIVGPAEVGVLASINTAVVPVHRRPRVAILSTGDEVVGLGPSLPPGKIRDSNSAMLSALVKQSGGIADVLGIAGDSAVDVSRHLSSVGSFDLIVTSGGVSVGDYDIVKDVLQRHGEISLWQVQMKPGRPLAFGRIGRTPLLGLPGNPSAAFVSFLQFGRPAIRRMLGMVSVRLPEIRATLAHAIENAGGRRLFVRGVVRWKTHGPIAYPVARQGSGILSSACQANCLIVVPESSDAVAAGEYVTVQLFDDMTI